MTDPPKDLVEAITEGRALIVCGAGVSRLAAGNTAPGWKQLIEMGLEHAKRGAEPEWIKSCAALLESAKADLWLTAADMIQQQLGGCSDGRYRAFLRSAVGKLKATDSAVIEALRGLVDKNNRIATTNYDDLLCHGLKRQPVNWKDADSVAECLGGDHDAVLHLHGNWRDPASVVFSQDDYKRLRGAESAQFLQQLAAHNFTLVFVGCSNAGLADENVGELLDWFGTRWSGLGKKHYVLVREAELGATWPPAVTPVAYGKEYSELAGFLAALAPASAPASSSALPARDPFPPDPNMIGRRDRLEEVVRHLLAGSRPIIVPGGPGMGKTTLALAAAHDPRVKDRFGKARIFVNLEVAASAEAVLRSVATGLGVEITGAATSILDAMGALVAKGPTLAILDNVETPWHSEPNETEKILGHLAGLSGLQLVLTVRGETPRVPGGAVTLDDVERLKSEDARELFLRESRARFTTDAALPTLLAALDGHPLSIVLMAAQTDARSDLAGLAQDWDRHRAAVLARGPANDRLTSVRVSLGLSLDRLKDRPDAKRLLGLVALLPAGLQEEDVAALLPDARPDAARELETSRLVEIRNTRLAMLAPLRETAREEKLATAADEARLIGHFLAVAADGYKIGTDTWPDVRERVTHGAGNLDAMCMLALQRLVEADKDADLAKLEGALRGLAKLHRFGLPSEVSSVHSALGLSDLAHVVRLRASCFRSIGDIALYRSDHDTAQARYQEAKPLYERVGDLNGQAACIKGLGDVAFYRFDHDTARTRYEAARPLYERIDDLNGQADCIRSLGDIAFYRSDYNTARVQYEAARPLYERAGGLIGQASCINGLGDIALAHSDHDTARACYEQARHLYSRVGSLLGQANCIKGLGDIGLARFDHDTARVRYEEARPLYERVGDFLGQANCIKRLGDIALARTEPDTARARYEEALGLYARIPEPYSIGLTHVALMGAAANDADRDRHAAAARAAWASIGRQDLIAELLDTS
jgi:tetratricopeptide (TPR) repeat protein